MKCLFGCLLLMFSVVALGLGPEKVATIDRQLWPEDLSNLSNFNRASAAELKMFARILDRIDISSEKKIQEFTGIKQVNVEEVNLWVEKTRQILVANYQHACPTCDVRNWESLVKEGDFAISLKRWEEVSEKFHKYYLYEQIRLAALFPRITSEISLLDKNKEINGAGFEDLTFLLTYDDGPAEDRKLNDRVINPTADLVAALNKNGLHAQFFVLGERLEQVKPKPDIYRGQCLGSHGVQHKSHQKWDKWAESLKAAHKKLEPYRKGPHWIRPPYGQRHQTMLDDVAARGEKVMLWNIDSQDWNKKLTDQQVQDRIITLMLLWRHGIILYHDVHSRALANLPALNELTKISGLTFIDCNSMKLK